MTGLTLPVGTTLGGYVLQGVVGQGASGTVYRAKDADGLTVAFKLLHPNLAVDAAARQRLRREVELLQRIKAPSVARVVDAETQQAEAFVVTELIEGTSLESYLAQHDPYSGQELALLAEDLVQAVDLIHQAGVVHRDLKPSNVMLRPDGSVVLIDFGLAQEDNWSRLTGTGLIAGTPGFVAPELLRGAEVGPGADRWAAAALLLSAATGRPPFGTGTVEKVLARVLENDADTDGLDPSLAGWLTRATLPDPAMRLQLEPLVMGLAALARGEEALPPTLVAPVTDNAGSIESGDGAPWPAPSTTPLWQDQPVAEPWPESPPGAGAPQAAHQADFQAGQPLWPGGLGTQWQEPGDLPKATSMVSLALWLLASTWALHWPWPAGLGAVAVLLLGRTAWVGNRAVLARQRRFGSRRMDPARTAVGLPWYLLRALVGLLPGLILGGAVAAGGYWLVQRQTTWDLAVVGAVAVAMASLLAWWGPASSPTRFGQRLVLRTLAPPWWSRALIGAAAIAGALALAWPALR